jgi:glycosyltransferase involved in cell wall biosynthesis
MSQLINNGNLIEFWHVGSIDKQINSFIKKYKNSSIIFFGHKSFSSLPKYYSKSSVLCIPSIHDGLALVIPQALACGLPIICTKNSGGSEFVKNGYNGFLVKPYSVKSIQHKVLKLYNDRNLLIKLSFNSLKIKNTKLDWKHYGTRIIKRIDSYKKISQN